MCYVNQKHASGNFPTWQLADGEEGAEEGGVGWGVGEGGKKKKPSSFLVPKFPETKCVFVYGDVYLLPLDPD